MSQLENTKHLHTMTAIDLVSVPDFQVGFWDAWQGKPFPDHDKKAQPAVYEGGRLVAVWIRSKGVTRLPADFNLNMMAAAAANANKDGVFP